MLSDCYESAERILSFSYTRCSQNRAFASAPPLYLNLKNLIKRLMNLTSNIQSKYNCKRFNELLLLRQRSLWQTPIP